MNFNFIIAAIVATSAASLTAVQAIPCTPAQLEGNFDSFRLPGGGGDYFSGTRQVVSWNWPVGSDVNEILSVSVLNATDSVQPLYVLGAPVTIPSVDHDQAGSIRVTLPELDVGKYVFGVQVLSGGDQCTVYSAPFNIISENESDNDNSDVDRCNFGDTRCARQSTGFRSCVDTARGRRFGMFQLCPNGQMCEQAVNNAYCTLGNSNNGDRCDIGESRCARNNTGYRTCIDTPNGRRFRQFQICPSGQTCRQGDTTATCALGSNNGGNVQTGQVCYTLAEYACLGDSFIVCQRDVNGGLVWSASTPCGIGQTCRVVDDNLNCVLRG